MKYIIGFIAFSTFIMAYSAQAYTDGDEKKPEKSYRYTPYGLVASGYVPYQPLNTKQKDNPRAASPDFPGNLVVQLGLSYLVNNPESLNTNLWGSKSVSLYYMYGFTKPTSRFSFNVGLGLGLDRYKLNDNNTIAIERNDEGQRIVVLDSIEGVDDLRKSKVVTDYVDLPIEFRAYLNPTRKEKSLFIAAGASGGVLFDSKTKIVSTTGGIRTTDKEKTNWEINRWRYSVHFRIGIKGINAFYRLGLSEIWNSGRGPEGAPTKASTFGLSFIGF